MKKRNVIILAGGGGPAEPLLYMRSGLADDVKSKCVAEQATTRAFTMAEILLSLTIIGVVAAITLPSLTGNINERTWNTQRKALYARMSQAIALMPALNGYGTFAEDESGSVTDTAAETFVTDGLSKVLKINNICDSEHLADCGIPTSYTNLIGSAKSVPGKLSQLNNAFVDVISASVGGSIMVDQNPQHDIDTKAAAFETQNGESILVFYNPYCISNPGLYDVSGYFTQPLMCANFIYDLNGNKGPNTVGKDIGFITALYSSDTVVVAPMPLNTDATANMVVQPESMSKCVAQDADSRLPNIDELAAMFYNNELVGITNDYYWSGTRFDSGISWCQAFNFGNRYALGSYNQNRVRCVKR